MVDLGEPNIFRKEIVVLTFKSETKEIFMKSALQMMCKLTDCVNCIITLLMINENCGT